MSVTALTVSLEPVDRKLAGLETACLWGRRFSSAADVQAAWLDAIAEVRTDHFFFIDDDDELPENYLEVIDRCVRADAGVAYTDEIAGSERCSSEAYSQARHLERPMLLHHLVVCRTDVAREALKHIPRGHFWPEMQLFWTMAALAGAAHIPEIGYLWNRTPGGLHRRWFTVLGVSRSRAWCAHNRSFGSSA